MHTRNLRFLDKPREAKNFHAMLGSLFCARSEIKVQALDVPGFWYKVLFFTPYGILISDTGRCALVDKKEANFLLKRCSFKERTLEEVHDNWVQFGPPFEDRFVIFRLISP